MLRRRWIAGVVVVVVGWTVVAGVLLVRAALDLRDGRHAALQARDQLSAESVAAGTPLEPLRRAADHLRRAAATTGNPLLAPLRFAPVVGRQLRSVHALSGAVAEVSDAAADGVGVLQGVLDGRGLGGADRIRQLETLDAAVATMNRRVQAVDDLGPRAGLVSPLVHARNEVASRLAEAKASLADATAGTGAALRLLRGPRTYLLVAANNAEMRAGSGMWLSAGPLDTADGKLTLGDVKPIYEYVVPDGVVTPTGDLAGNWGWLRPELDWRNLMASPDFPASAELATEMWAAAGQGSVDGVLVLDPVALQALVASTGPVQLADGTTETADEVVPDLLHDQYAGVDRHDDRRNAARVDRLSQLTGAVFSALEAGSWSPAALARELGQAVRGRHLLAWSSHAEEQAGWKAAGMGGELTPDTLAVSLLNTSGNKLDWFVTTDNRLSVEPGATTTAVRLTVDIAADVPAGESSFVADPDPALAKTLAYGDYQGLLAVNVPGSAADVVVDGVDRVQVRGRDGPTQVVAATVVVRRGQTKSVTVSFDLPGTIGTMLIVPSGRVPPAEWQYGKDSWQDKDPHRSNF